MFRIDAFTGSEITNEDIYNLAESYFEVGRWEDAIEQYNKSIECNLEIANSYLGISLSLFMLNKNELGIETLLKAYDSNSGAEFSFLDEFAILDSTHLYINLTDSI